MTKKSLKIFYNETNNNTVKTKGLNIILFPLIFSQPISTGSNLKKECKDNWPALSTRVDNKFTYNT